MVEESVLLQENSASFSTHLRITEPGIAIANIGVSGISRHVTLHICSGFCIMNTPTYLKSVRRTSENVAYMGKQKF